MEETFFEKVAALSRKFYKTPVMVSSWERGEYDAVWRCISSNAVVDGPATEKIEKLAARFAGKSVAGTNGASAAMYAALKPLQRGEVVMPSYACNNILNAVRDAGHSPVLADVDEDYNLAPEAIREKLSRKTVAVIVPSMYGKPAELAEIEKELPSRVRLLDDAAQCLGARHKGKPVGSFGYAGAYSLGAKTVTATGGGLLLTKHEKALETARALQREKQGRVLKRLVDCLLRYSFRKTALPLLTAKHVLDEKLGRRHAITYGRLSNLDAELALAQWPKVDEINRRRVANARVLVEELSSSGMDLPSRSKEHVYSKFVVRLPAKKERRKTPWPVLKKFVRGMAKRGIECEWCYTPLHLRGEPAKGGLDTTERLWWRSISLPNHAGMGEEEAKEVADAAKKTLAEIL